MGRKNTAAKAQGKTGRAAADDDDAILEAAFQEVSQVTGKAAEFNAVGEECLGRGDWPRAIEQFTKSIEVDPNNGMHYCRRSAASMYAGHPIDALADAKTAVSRGGVGPEETAACHAQLGFVLQKDGKLQAALETFDRGLKVCPQSASCRQGREEVRVHMERKGGQRAPPQRGDDDVEAQELRTLPAPEGVLGKGFEVLHLRVGTLDKPLRFLLCTSLTSEAVITANTCGKLGLKIQRSVDLEDVSFEGGREVGSLKNVQVTGFFQATMADKALNSPVDGMLGLPFMARYDLDLDRVRSEQRVKEAGAAAAAMTARTGFKHFPGISLPGSLLGVPVQIRASKKTVQCLGVIDTGSMFSVMNWRASKELAIADHIDDSSLRNATKVAGAATTGIVEMPLVSVKVHLCSAADEVGCRTVGVAKEDFDATGKGNGWYLDFKSAGIKPCVEFGRVNAAIGDAIQFACLSDSSVGDFSGPAILIGQDILAQAPRLTFSGRDRQLWLDPPGRIVDEMPV